ncbi:hypothetical protein LZ31DRAFT_339710 [Colletotrichum somersetense]|nr:hypothetical protein LZ31DRAFT_339710 [Colletotrichum somersetense]
MPGLIWSGPVLSGLVWSGLDKNAASRRHCCPRRWRGAKHLSHRPLRHPPLFVSSRSCNRAKRMRPIAAESILRQHQRQPPPLPSPAPRRHAIRNQLRRKDEDAALTLTGAARPSSPAPSLHVYRTLRPAAPSHHHIAFAWHRYTNLLVSVP